MIIPTKDEPRSDFITFKSVLEFFSLLIYILMDALCQDRLVLPTLKVLNEPVGWYRAGEIYCSGEGEFGGWLIETECVTWVIPLGRMNGGDGVMDTTWSRRPSPWKSGPSLCSCCSNDKVSTLIWSEASPCPVIAPWKKDRRVLRGDCPAEDEMLCRKDS